MSFALREQSVGKLVTHHPRVSIIIPNYNTAEFISQTLNSVFAQTFADYEVIVINDAAPDSAELYEAIEPYRDRIVFLDKVENHGTSTTRNHAATHARGEILAFLDADDIWYPTFLEETLAFKGSGGYDFAYADAETFGLKQSDVPNFLPANPEQGTITRQLLIAGKCHILPSGALIDRRVFEAAGGFDPDVKRTEDFDLWMRMIFAGVKIGYLRKILFRFRLRPGSGTGDSLQRIERCRDVWRILQAKLPFTAEENAQIEINVAHEEAALVRAEGRLAIAHRDWPTARLKFAEASKYASRLGLPFAHRAKMLALRTALTLAPFVVHRAMSRFRAGELEHMP